MASTTTTPEYHGSLQVPVKTKIINYYLSCFLFIGVVVKIVVFVVVVLLLLLLQTFNFNWRNLRSGGVSRRFLRFTSFTAICTGFGGMYLLYLLLLYITVFGRCICSAQISLKFIECVLPKYFSKFDIFKTSHFLYRKKMCFCEFFYPVFLFLKCKFVFL